MAYSGGVDSKALLYALREYHPGLPLVVVHVNHGWRLESDQEEKEIGQECAVLHIPFYSEKLVTQSRDNREERARQDRYAYFHLLVKKLGAQGVVLAHHAQDQAETVLQRVLEGAYFLRFSAMQKEIVLKGLRIFRPLLEVEKKELELFVKERRLSYFHDSSNCDPRYLRARLRSHLFPLFEEVFGKNFQKNLLFLGKTAQGFSDYLARRAALLKEHSVGGPFGQALFRLSSLDPCEREYLIRQKLEEGQYLFSRASLLKVLASIKEKKSGLFFPFGKEHVYLYRDMLFFWKRQVAMVHPKTIDLGMSDPEKRICPLSWTDYFRGDVRFFVPVGKYYTLQVAPASCIRSCAKKGIPLPLRKRFPVLVADTGDVHAPFFSTTAVGKWITLPLSECALLRNTSPETPFFGIFQNGDEVVT